MGWFQLLKCQRNYSSVDYNVYNVVHICDFGMLRLKDNYFQELNYKKKNLVCFDFVQDILIAYLLKGIPWNSLCDVCMRGYGLQIVAIAIREK